MLITPSILTNSPQDVFSQIDRLSPFFHYFQIDIADGRFVDNKTVQLSELINYCKTNQLPQKYDVDFHLMVEDIEGNMKLLRELQPYLTIHNVLVHIKLKPDYTRLKQEYAQYVIGLVYNPEDGVQEFTSDYPLNTCDLVQIMSVNPGKQGSSFIKESLYKLQQLRNKGYRNKILLDGAVNKETLQDILSAPIIPDCVGPGSYLSKADDLPARVTELRAILMSHGQTMEVSA